MTTKPPPAVICDNSNSEYLVMRNNDRQNIISGAIVIFPEEHRWLQPIVEQLGLKLRADALKLKWEQVDKDKDNMLKLNENEEQDEY